MDLNLNNLNEMAPGTFSSNNVTPYNPAVSSSDNGITNFIIDVLGADAGDDQVIVFSVTPISGIATTLSIDTSSTGTIDMTIESVPDGGGAIGYYTVNAGINTVDINTEWSLTFKDSNGTWVFTKSKGSKSW